jgi:CheY-like chemotaxis protein
MAQMNITQCDTAMAEREMRPRVLIVEDEYLVAMLVEDMLQTLGYEVVQVAATLDAAMNAARNSSFDVAILDINLNGTQSSPVAEILTGRGIPFIFATGYGPAGLDSHYAGTPTLQKPFYEDELKRLLGQILEQV